MRRQRLAVVITGVSRGLGRAMAASFIRRGYAIFGCARTQSAIAALKRAYPDHDFQVVDIASDHQVRLWSAHVLSRSPPPHLLLNNAAVIPNKVPLWGISAREFSSTLNVNLNGSVNVIRHFVPAMISDGRGVVVNFVSRWAQASEETMGPYCASKSALVALTRSLAQELRETGVTAVALNPGIIRTDMLRRYLAAKLPLSSTFPSPDEWARAAVPFILKLRKKDSGKVRRVPTLL